MAARKKDECAKPKDSSTGTGDDKSSDAPKDSGSSNRRPPVNDDWNWPDEREQPL